MFILVYSLEMRGFVYIDFVLKNLSNLEYLHINLKVSLNSGDFKVSWLFRFYLLLTKGVI